MKPGHDLSRASLGELQQELQVRIKDLQSRREALVRELQEVDEQLLARNGRPRKGEAQHQPDSDYPSGTHFERIRGQRRDTASPWLPDHQITIV